MIKKLLFALFNLFYKRHYYRFCTRKIEELPPDVQLFFVTRRDYGTYFHLLHYIRCWNKQRGKTCLVILTGYMDLIEQLARIACPDTILIGPDDPLTLKALRYFGARRIHLESFAKVYARLVIDFPRAIFIYHQASRHPASLPYSAYIPHFDRNYDLFKEKFSEKFLKAYFEAKVSFDIREDTYRDMFNLSYSVTDFTGIRKRTENQLTFLKKILEIPDQYVILNINCKDYTHQNTCTNRKRIHHPERYNVLIDALIEKGYAVVIQGRKEQPKFKERPGLIDYAKSSQCSPENDLALYSGAFFSIISKSGPDLFTTLCGTPLLGLNYVEPILMASTQKMRYFFKHHRKEGRYLHWQEFLQEPCYFNMGAINFDTAVTYEELQEGELLEALDEFLLLLASNEWSCFTPLQKAFKEALTPLHIDLYALKAVPCDAYLRRTNRITMEI